MSRVIFDNGKQKIWLQNLLNKNQVNIDEMAKLCGVSPRTIRDWKREKFTITLGALTLLSRMYRQAIPKKIKVVDDYWYGLKGAKAGGLARVQLYGPPGSREDRVKGGLVSQRRRRENPERYKNCNLAKNFDTPRRNKELAELVGIILGDGSITHNQLKITLNKKTEGDYANYVSGLMELVFGEKPTRHYHENVCCLTITGVNLIRLLNKFGVSSHNKVLQQAKVPDWIIKKSLFATNCLRGLMDTDGCIYTHSHTVREVRYYTLGICFSNHSKPLLNFVYKQLLKLKFSAKLKKDSNIFLYRQSEVIKYIKTVGSNNGLYSDRLIKFVQRKGAGVV